MKTSVYNTLLRRRCHFIIKVFSRKMTCESQGYSVAVCQITAKHDKEENFETCSKLIKKAAERNARIVFLPEACDYMGRNTREILSLAEPLNGPIIGKYKELAKRHKIWISLGGVHEKAVNEKVRNSHVIINEMGDIAGVYSKIHLFDVEIPEKNLSLMESKYVERGMQIVPPVSSPIGRIGMGICYDLRFPVFSQRLVKMGAEILTYPSAFTTSTGPDHWEVLLRARAIESQCYVIAAAQTGTHFKGRSSYGHGMVIDPWGKVLAEFKGEDEDIIIADVDLKKLATVRQNMPKVNHQRDDLYHSKTHIMMMQSINNQTHYQFGPVSLKNSVVFFKTLLTIAFVNKKCVLPGHVLVAPLREVKRLADLTTEEAIDFFEVIRTVQQGMEEVHSTSSSTVTVQDGKYAGQTVFHIHAHIIPRKMNDLDQNDEIYKRLENHEADASVKVRTEEEMENEAIQLRQYFKT